MFLTKNAEQLAAYTKKNLGEMRKWYNFEYKYLEKLINTCIADLHIKSKKDNELISGIRLFDLESNVIVDNYILALGKCSELTIEELASDSKKIEIVMSALDIILQDMAECLSTHIREQYLCLKNNGYFAIARANKLRECVMYFGPYGIHSPSAYHLFSDDGVFMTDGLNACKPLFYDIKLFQ